MNNIQFNQAIYKRLAPREIEVARAAATGNSVKATADLMGITYHTAKNHRASIMKKMSCKNMTEVVVSLKDAGIL